ncbi:hypothetical protein QBC32DRAFT_369667 [Pseudoneurospora amorphoporcata]|uniref:Uncharacterized protein n=1 Tax=Pseudoneurospora amorphoporcata TaxID=241081 RepID=A0AAN6SHI5_9PEZI|nr:hypothetical protein QBC32DRAFT_369667 [Pseudoneurospora amorphoporcata]
MFSYLTQTVVRIATPLIYPIIAPIVRPAIAHAVGYIQPIEADFDFDKVYRDNPLAVSITKVINIVDGVRKLVKEVCKAPVVLKKLKSLREEPIAVASQIVKDVAGVVKHFVPTFFLSTIRTYIGTGKATSPAERWWIRPDEAKLKAWLSVDNAGASSVVRPSTPAKGTPSSAYPSTPPPSIDLSSPPGGRTSPGFDTAATPPQETDTTTVVDFPLSAYSPDIEASQGLENTISSLDLGSTISSLNLGESLDSPLTSQADPIALTNDNDNDFSEIALPNYSPTYGGGSNNTNTPDPEKFSENEEDAVSRARAIAFRPDHEETDRLDSSLEQIPQEARVGSEESEIEDGMEELFETEEVKEQGGEPVNEAEIQEAPVEPQDLENPAELARPVIVTSQPTSTPANITDNANTAKPVNVSSHQEEDVTANIFIPPTQPQEAEEAEGPIRDTETVYPEDGNLEPYVFNWVDYAFIDETGHLDTYKRVEDAKFDPTKQHLHRCHWIGVTEVDKPKQIITRYLGPVDSSGQQPSLPAPELTLTTPEGDTWWLDDPLPWGRLCMSRQWLSQSFVDENGYMDTWRRVVDEERRELVERGQLRLQRDNWVLLKCPPLEIKPEGVPELTVTVTGGATFYLDEPRSWADLDDDDEDW